MCIDPSLDITSCIQCGWSVGFSQSRLYGPLVFVLIALRLLLACANEARIFDAIIALNVH